MITIAIRFLAGRYHATPWGSHVNEGLVEWPPCPWRFLRSLLATGFAKLGWDTVPDAGARLVERLAGVLPEYGLPRGETAHSRHYMPVSEGRKETTTKVLDAFVRLRTDDPLLIRYPVELPSDERELLAQLVSNLSYVGRAESWAEGELLQNNPTDGDWCRACRNSEGPLPGGDQVSLLATVSESDYVAWRTSSVESALARDAESRAKKLTPKQSAAVALPFPETLLDCLLCDTLFLQKHGWSQPPGSRRVLYNRPPRTLEPRPARSPRRQRASRTVEAGLLALSSDTVRGDLLPLMTRCVRQAEFIHEALASILFKQLRMNECAALLGKDRTGQKLGVGHRHSHYLPLDLDEDGRLDHVLIYAPMGLDTTAQRCITRLRRTWTKGSDKDILVTCAGFGDLNLFRRQLRTRSGSPIAVLPPQPSTVWSSVTPYVASRHLKPGRYTIEDDVRRELRVRGLSDPVRIEVFNYAGPAGRNEFVKRRLMHFVRTRRDGKPQPPAPNVFGLRVQFPLPVQDPLALGYASHFGLGLLGAEITR
jgi:CRISPR-associated protein Csb2